MNELTPLSSTLFVGWTLLVLIWTIPLKIYAVWTAVKYNQKKWFVALLILNTLGILEIFYIFKIAKKSWVEVKEDFKNALSSVKN